MKLYTLYPAVFSLFVFSAPLKSQTYYSAGWSDYGTLPDASYGWSMENAGDVNGDGYPDLIVGSTSHSEPENEEGKMYLYYGGPDGLSTIENWTYQSNFVNGDMGFSCSGGDVNGDGYSDIVAGGTKLSDPETQEGKVWVFYGSPTGPGGTYNWTWELNQPYAILGSGCAMNGDINGDGYDDLIVSAKMYSNPETDEGGIWIFYGSPTGPSATPDWHWESNQAFAIAGFPVNYAGDINGDGYDDFLIAINAWDGALNDEGAVAVFYGSPSGPASTPDLFLQGDQKKAYFGHWADGAGDVNGDGYDDVVVSSLDYDDVVSNEGRVWLFYGGPSGLNPVAGWNGETHQANSSLGYCVAGAGDIDGDGYDDIIAGEKYWDNADYTDEGAAFVWFGSPSGPESDYCWTDEGGQDSAYYGRHVGGFGDFNKDGYSDFFVGAYNYTAAINTEGKAYVYYGKPREDAFHYTSDTYCVDGPDPTPVIDGLAGGSFSSSAGLVFSNPTNGTIDLSATGVGGPFTVSYTVNSVCTLTKSVSVFITPPLDASFSYPSSTYLQSDPNPYPTAAPGAVLGNFTSTPAGLIINPDNGSINLSASATGTYTITNTVNSPSCGTASAHFTLMVVTGCSKPTGLNVSSITSTSAMLSWNPVAGATSYKVYLKQVGAPSAAYNAATNSYSLSGLASSTQFRVFVVAKCPGGGTSPKSANKNFMTLAMRFGESPAALSVYPNPASTRITVSLRGFSGDQEICIFNAMGQKVKEVQAGTSEMEISIGDLPPGIYLLQAGNNGDFQTAEFIVSR